MQTSLVVETEPYSVHVGIRNTCPGAGKGSAWSSAALTMAWLFAALLNFKP